MSGTETFRFIRSPTGDIYPMFERHEHDRKWQPVSDFEAYEFFKAAGADLEALGLSHIAEMAEAIQSSKPAARAPSRRAPRGLKPAEGANVFGAEQIRQSDPSTAEVDDLLAGLDLSEEDGA